MNPSVEHRINVFKGVGVVDEAVECNIQGVECSGTHWLAKSKSKLSWLGFGLNHAISSEGCAVDV
jgi:hypothetical protein